MKKWIAWILSLFLLLGSIGCTSRPPEVIRTIEGNLKTYYEMSDGTWQWNGYTYQYHLEISGRQPFAVVDSYYVYLSNIEDISFEQAMMASGLSSSIKDYFNPEEAVLVELGTK